MNIRSSFPYISGLSCVLSFIDDNLLCALLGEELLPCFSLFLVSVLIFRHLLVYFFIVLE